MTLHCMCLHHILFIQSSIDGRLGYFYFLASVNNAAIHTGEQITDWILPSVLLDI